LFVLPKSAAAKQTTGPFDAMSNCDEESDEYKRTVEGFRDGAPAAFEQLWLCHNSEVLAYLANRPCGRKDPVRVSQQAWIKVWIKRQQFKGGCFRAWLFTIVRTTCIDMGRYDSSKKRNADTGLGSIPEGFDPPDRRDDGHPLDEEITALRECLQQLAAMDSDVFETFQVIHLGDHTVESAMEIIGIPRATVYTRVFRAKKQLRACIEKKMSQS
jgi:RNA polymerase sigma factor (sigma-70 family)